MFTDWVSSFMKYLFKYSADWSTGLPPFWVGDFHIYSLCNKSFADWTYVKLFSLL